MSASRGPRGRARGLPSELAGVIKDSHAHDAIVAGYPLEGLLDVRHPALLVAPAGKDGLVLLSAPGRAQTLITATPLCFDR